MRAHPATHTRPCADPIQSVRKRTTWGISLLLGLLCASAAHGQSYVYDLCNTGDHTATVYLEDTFKPHADRYDVLTDWLSYPPAPALSCTRYSKAASSQLKAWLRLASTMPGALQQNFNLDGETYNIYPAGPGTNPAIGYILRRRLVIDGANKVHPPQSNWIALNSASVSAQHTPFTVTHKNKTLYSVRVDAQVRLIRWGKGGNFPSGDFVLDFPVATFKYETDITGKPPYNPSPEAPYNYNRGKFHFRVNANIARSDKTCSTQYSPNPVRLPTVTASDLATKADEGETSFTLELTNCDADIVQIEYSLEPTVPGDTSDLAKGLLALSSNSTASGVMLQVLNEDGTPVSLIAGERVLVHGYHTGDSGISIPLKVKYTQSGDITVGRVYAAMNVLYTYK